ncbi:MAG TPA: hypothetical protein PLV93_01625 [Microthrixaceae bacterium]|nr:hypothetical protein [Microthrixaceae bacterium]HNI34063.1 hypothetical protein [Microthrixaceae bacterium]
MTPQRLALGVLATLSGVAAFYLATADVHYRDRNCGTAVFRSDVTQLVIESGDIAADEFEQESVITNCDQLLLERRFLVLAPVALGVVCVVAGRRARDRQPPPKGDIFGRA